MEQLQQLLTELECISLADISAIPEPSQHVVAERLEELQDELRRALQTSQWSRIHPENHYLVYIWSRYKFDDLVKLSYKYGCNIILHF